MISKQELKAVLEAKSRNSPRRKTKSQRWKIEKLGKLEAQFNMFDIQTKEILERMGWNGEEIILKVVLDGLELKKKCVFQYWGILPWNFKKPEIKRS